MTDTTAPQARREQLIAPADSLAPADSSRFDVWVRSNPWHPRVLPEMAYLVLMSLSMAVQSWVPAMYPAAYAVQCGATAVLLWRYRKLTPELTLHFHWTAPVAGLIVFAVWVPLGISMSAWFPRWFDYDEWNYFDQLGRTGGWIMLVLKFMGMCLVVPLFEELFNRSLLLRSFSHFRRTGIGLVNLVQDMPVLDDVLLENKWAKKAVRHHHVFADMFNETPLGKLTFTGVFVSSIVFMLAHSMRDWPAAIFCGVMYCLVLWWTNRGDKKLGLGPAIWAHAITNAMLWVYTLHTGDWRFM